MKFSLLLLSMFLPHSTALEGGVDTTLLREKHLDLDSVKLLSLASQVNMPVIALGGILDAANPKQAASNLINLCQ